MNKRELGLLEQVFAAEIDGALNKNHLGIFQTKSKLGQKLVDDGYLVEKTIHIAEGPFTATVRGYRLTQLGHLTYCMSDAALDKDQP